MILWFLRRFSQFLELESLSVMQAARIEIVDRDLVVMTADRDKWRHDCVEEGNRRSELRADHRDQVSKLENRVRTLETDLGFSRNACEEMSTEKLLLQDRLDSAIQDKEQLWGTMQEALSGERNALRMQINHAVQKAGGGIPYPDSHALPANAAYQPQKPGPIGRTARVLPSEMQSRANHNFMEEWVATVAPVTEHEQ